MYFSLTTDFVRKIENDTANFGRAWAESAQSLLPAAGIEAQRVAGGIAVFAGVGSPLTQALGIGLDGPVPPKELERLEAFFFQRGAAADLELTPYIDASVLEWIRMRPYSLAEFSQVLALDLGHETPAQRAPGDSVVVSIATPEQYKLFTSTVAHGYSHGSPVPESDLLIFEGSAHATGALSFLATVAGKPAGGATLTLQDGIAGLHGGSTLPEFRGCGVQTALILARLHEARQRGSKIAITVTLPDGSSRRNMERFGFLPTYTRVKVSRPVAKR